MTPRSPRAALTSRWRPRPYPALAIALACWSGFGVIAALTGRGAFAPVDRAGLLLCRKPDLLPLGPAWLTVAIDDVTALGGTPLRSLFALAIIVALLFLGRRRDAGLLAAIAAGGWALCEALKHAAHRARPTLVPYLTTADGFSFPSSHSFNAAVVYLGSALILTAASGRSVRTVAVAAALVIVPVIGCSRVWLGVHYPSDVLAGWLGGIGWLATGATAAGLGTRRERGAAG